LACELAARLAIRTADARTRLQSAVVAKEDSKSTLIRSKERDRGVAYIRQWMEESLDEYLKICDPYFGPDDLDAVVLMRSIVPQCRVFIVTSKKNQDSLGILSHCSSAYHNSWVRLCAQDPPETDIIVVGTRNTGELPIHDRWWITKGSGLRMGTSFKSLGSGKDSELSLISPGEAARLERQLDEYISHLKREHQGERLLYTHFTLE
jgi:hypothetical protein